MRLHPLLLQLPVLLLLPKLQLHLLLPPLILRRPKPQIALLRCVPNWAVSFAFVYRRIVWLLTLNVVLSICLLDFFVNGA